MQRYHYTTEAYAYAYAWPLRLLFLNVTILLSKVNVEKNVLDWHKVCFHPKVQKSWLKMK